jgi:hypothetical protein
LLGIEDPEPHQQVEVLHGQTGDCEEEFGFDALCVNVELA